MRKMRRTRREKARDRSPSKKKRRKKKKKSSRREPLLFSDSD